MDSNINSQSGAYGSFLRTEGDLAQLAYAATKENGAEVLLEKTQGWSFEAGILYVILIVCGMVAEVGIRGNLLYFNDPVATAENIQAHPAQLRWAFMLDLVMSCCDVLISLLLGGILTEKCRDE
ncbi:hypothetical protein ACA910_018425 [Epithemia clementina (nom. ined.)]